MGMGPMTGRGVGYCAGSARPGFMSVIGRCGHGMRLGRGRGLGMGMAWRHGRAGWGYPSPNAAEAAPQNEVEILKDQAKCFGEALENINKRIAELVAEKK